MKRLAVSLWRTRRNRVALWSAALGLVLAGVGGAALALPSQRPPDGTAVTLSGADFTLTGHVAKPLVIGHMGILIVTIHNFYPVPIRVTDIQVRAVSLFHGGCHGAWIQARRYLASAKKGTFVPSRAQRSVRLPIHLVNVSGVNENACQHLSVPLRLIGHAVTVK